MKHLVAVLIALSAAVVITTAALQTAHDEAFAAVLTSGGYDSTPAAVADPPSSLQAALFSAFAAPNGSFASTGALPDPNTPVTAVSVPIAAFPICVAYNVPAAAAQLGFNATDLPRLLGADTTTRAGLAVRDFGDDVAVPDAAALSVFLPATPITAAVLDRLQSVGTVGGTLETMKARATAVLPTVADVAERIRTTPNSVGVVPLSVAIQSHLACAAWRKVTRVARREVWTFIPPKVVARAAGTLAVTTSSASTNSDAVYPLLGPAVVTVPTACLTNASATSGSTYAADLVGALGSTAFKVHTARWGVVVLPAKTLARSLNVLAATVCGAPSRVAGVGSSAVLALVSALALEYVNPARGAASPPFVDYPGGGSGAGLRGIEGRTAFFAASDAAYSDADYAAHPTVSFVPATALAVAVVFNVGGGIVDLTIPACLVIGLFNGSITHWNHPALVRSNPYVVLPPTPVVPVVRGDQSGTTVLFTAGLRALDQQCTNGAANVAVGKGWALSAAATVLAAGTTALITTVLNTPGAVGYAGHPEALVAGIPEAQVQLLGGTTVGPSAAAVTQALSGASIDARLRMSLGVVAGGYPFTGVTYYLFDSAMPASPNCSVAKEALLFVKDALTDSRALAVQSRLSFVPIPAAITAQSVASLERATCGGELLLVGPPSSSVNYLLVAVIPAIGGAVIIAAVLVLLFIMCRGGARDVSNAPKGSPVSFVFTDIQASTALWSFAPVAMATALDTHHLTIRAVIAKHKAYEVKTVGDSFMVACNDPATAMAVAMDLQEALFDAPWGTSAFDTGYRELLTEYHGPVEAQAYISGGSWSGLRVRVGVHHGDCAPQLDPVTKGYDYYGTAVNTAARVEAVGHGGQTVITSTVYDALSDEQRAAAHITKIGPVELRGLDVPVVLYTAVPKRFTSRSFPALRCGDAAADNRFDPPTEESATTGSAANVAVLDDTERYGLLYLEVLLSTMKPPEAETLLKALSKAWRVAYKSGAYTDGAAAAKTAQRRGSTTSARGSAVNGEGSASTAPTAGAGLVSFAERAFNTALVPLCRRVAPVLERCHRRGGVAGLLDSTTRGSQRSLPATDRAAVYFARSERVSLLPLPTSPSSEAGPVVMPFVRSDSDISCNDLPATPMALTSVPSGSKMPLRGRRSVS